MSPSTKVWITVVVVLLLALIGGLWYMNSQPNSIPAPAPQPAQPAPTPTPVPQPEPIVPAQPANDAGMSAPTDTSNASLEQDLNTVDNQLNNLNVDVTNAATGTVQ